MREGKNKKGNRRKNTGSEERRKGKKVRDKGVDEKRK